MSRKPLARWLCAVAAFAVGAAAQQAPPAYRARGDEAEALHGKLTAELSAAHAALWHALEVDAPDLVGALRAEPPAPLAYGYGVVPILSADAQAEPDREPALRRYSWPHTRDLIGGVERELGALTARLAALPAGAGRRKALEELVEGYLRIEANTRNAGEHVRYNQLWQASIAEDPGRFARESQLIADLLELRTTGHELERAPPGETRALLEKRANALRDELDAVRHRREPRAFLRVERSAEGRCTLHVPVYTDIGDASFRASVEAAIEGMWQVTEAGAEYRVDVDLRAVSPAMLYAPAAAPASGIHLDLPAHVARFAGDGGVLTTGAVATHVVAGRAIVLGPEPIARFVLAHEFGHVLGFRDGYLRGARDLGREGYEVSELEIDPADLMSSPATGRVLRSHFEALGVCGPREEPAPGPK